MHGNQRIVEFQIERSTYSSIIHDVYQAIYRKNMKIHRTKMNCLIYQMGFTWVIFLKIHPKGRHLTKPIWYHG